jgi:hypothetical protein
MKKHEVRFLQYFCVILFFSLTFTSSLHSQQRYYRGNTHTHSYPASGDVSDPFYRPSKIVSEYKALGYDFLVFTDHGTYWDAEELSTGDFTVISGEELGVSYPGQQGHYSGINLWNTIIGAGIPHPAVIELILGQGGIPILNHPTWTPMALSAAAIIAQVPPFLRHMEIVNASTMNEPETKDIPLWDELLSSGRMLYGIASDDSHNEGQQGKAWIMVSAQNNRKQSLMDAVQRGNYYCSSGITIDTMRLDRELIFVRSRQCDTIRLIGKDGISLRKEAGSEISYIPKGNEGYLRVELSNGPSRFFSMLRPALQESILPPPIAM